MEDQNETTDRHSREDMVSFWSAGFQEHVALKYTKEEADKLAEDMQKSWKQAGLRFRSLMKDYLSHPMYCPINRSTGKDWYTILTENRDLLPVPPHALIMSTLKYFKSRTDASFMSIDLPSWAEVLAEEKLRLDEADKNVLFIRFADKPGLRCLKSALHGMFKQLKYFSPLKDMAKLVFNKGEDKDVAVKLIKSQSLRWPHSNEAVSIVNVSSFGLTRYLEQFKIIETQLTITNYGGFKTYADLPKIRQDLFHLFPGFQDFKSEQNYKRLILNFKTVQGAYASFAKGKNVIINGCQVTVVYNRDRRQPLSKEDFDATYYPAGRRDQIKVSEAVSNQMDILQSILKEQDKPKETLAEDNRCDRSQQPRKVLQTNNQDSRRRQRSASDDDGREDKPEKSKDSNDDGDNNNRSRLEKSYLKRKQTVSYQPNKRHRH